MVSVLTEREEEMAAANPRAKRFGPGGINKPMKNTWCPLHFAVANKRKVSCRDPKEEPFVSLYFSIYVNSVK